MSDNIVGLQLICIMQMITLINSQREEVNFCECNQSPYSALFKEEEEEEGDLRTVL